MKAEGVFQSTRPQGARRAQVQGGAVRGHVSIHAPARGATADGTILWHRLMVFQSTRPQGARLRYGTPPRLHVRFNPRARKGRDRTDPLQHHSRHVSIHAPARGATIVARRKKSVECVSIHAPARGATFSPPTSSTAQRRFNPRARKGRDETTWSNGCKSRSFNPRARKGRDRSQ